MKAIVFDEQLRIDNDYPVPRRQPGEALIRVALAGICNTDLEITRGYMGFRGILGHEFVGTVVESDDAASVGRRVVGEINLPCLKCDYCRSGLGNHCPNRSTLGILNKDGAFAELLTLPERVLHPVPDGLSDEEAVFVEPLAACFEILEQVKIRPEERVLVLGDGKLGLLAAQVLAGATQNLALVGRHEEKLKIVRSLGITAFLPDEAPPQKADIVVDCTGSPDGFNAAVGMVKPRGTLVLKSTSAASQELNLASVVVDEITIVGSRCGPFPKALEALARRKVQVLPLITARYDLSQGIQAFEHARGKGRLKVLLKIY